MRYVKEFEVNMRELSQKEKVLFKKLVSATKLVAPLYSKQKNNKYPGADFYPHDANKEEIKEAAKNNPAILDPYTFVERDKSGKLIAVPYHLKFKKELKKISQLLKEAASLSSDKKLKVYLLSRAEALTTDNYDKSNILWLKTENSKIGCIIGPFDRYIDKLFFKKRAYMAWIGILDEKRTKEAKEIEALVLSSKRKYLPGAKKAEIAGVKVRLENTAIFSGLIADFMFVGNNLPSSGDLSLIKKYGTLFTVFNPVLKFRFEKWIFPIFRAIFGKNIQKKYSKKELYRAFVRSVILHEICHSLMRYEDSVTRLQEYFPFFDELYTDILGVKSYGFILLKDAITQKELETLLLVFVCRNLHWLHSVSTHPHLIHYATGGAISLNFLLEGGALKKENGIFRPNLQKLFICLDQLSHILDYYVALGNYNESKEFIKKYGQFNSFKKYFAPKLREIKKT